MPKRKKYKAEKRSEPVSLLVFHCFALPTKKMLDLFEKSGASVHYIIQRNGKVLKLVDEEEIAYHAGLSSWRNMDGLNGKSIGIELQNSAMGQQKYTAAQIKSLIKLAQDIIRRHNIEPQNIVGHSDIAPTRKPDPSKFFPWELLAKNGIGIWPKVSADSLIIDDTKIKELLEEIGYDTTDLNAAIYAFTTRFLPHKVEKQQNLIAREAEVFAYWHGVKADKIATKINNAPKIYPPLAKSLLKDKEILFRLAQITKAYNKKSPQLNT